MSESSINYNSPTPDQLPLYKFNLLVAYSFVMADLTMRAKNPAYPVISATYKAIAPEMRRIQEELFEQELYNMVDVSPRSHNYPLSPVLRVWLSSITGLRRAAKKFFTGSE